MRFGRAQLDRAFHPRCVAVVGDKQANGFLWLRALQQFQGALYSVQIDPQEIAAIEQLGVRNVGSLGDIPERVDYVVVAVPRQVAPHVVADCIRHEVAAATLFTAGFSETGDADGIRLEQQISAQAGAAGLLLVGPNCMGIANPAIGLCNFPGELAGAAAAGPVGFIGQSGTHTITFCMRAPAEGAGISKAVSFGNGAVADAGDYLDYLAADAETRVIAGYVEGVRDGRRFFESLRAAAAVKPVVLWKGGVSDAGQRAIFSHTAALATPAAIWRGLIRQAGAVAVESQDMLLDAVRTLLMPQRATGVRAGLIAMTGGPSVALTDAFTATGLDVPLLSESSYATLAEFFQTVGGSFRNPLDAGSTIAMGFRADNLQRLLSVLAGDPQIDLIVIDLGAGLAIDRWRDHPALADAVIEVLAAFAAGVRQPFAVIVDAPHRAADALALQDRLRRRGVLTFASAARAAAALRLGVEHARHGAGLEPLPPS